MTLKRMDHISIVVDDLPAAVAYFDALGLSSMGEARLEGSAVDGLNGMEGVQTEIVMMRTPDGNGRLELTKFHHPELVKLEPAPPPPNALGIRSVMFEIENIEQMIARLRAHGAELIGEVVQYEDQYKLCYLSGPGGIIVALAENLS